LHGKKRTLNKLKPSKTLQTLYNPKPSLRTADITKPKVACIIKTETEATDDPIGKRDDVMSVRRRTAAHGSIRRRNVLSRRKNIRRDSTTVQKDATTTVLTNDSNSIS